MPIKHVARNPLLTREHVAALKELIEQQQLTEMEPSKRDALTEAWNIFAEVEQNAGATAFALVPYAG